MATKSYTHGGQSGQLTTADIEAQNPRDNPRPVPEFIRVPTVGACPDTGLCRSKLYELVSPDEDNGFKPPVKSVSLRKPGQTKGTRLIVLQSLLDYLRGEVEAFQKSIGKEVTK